MPGRKALPTLFCTLALGGCCFPYETRPPDDSENEALRQMCRAVAERAGASGDRGITRVADALARAHQDGRILVFEDDPKIDDCRGLTILGRVYLHQRIFRPQWDPETLATLYHEGVHLTQSWLRLLFEPRDCEHEALESTWEFFHRPR
jgi:hypothetical protein